MSIMDLLSIVLPVLAFICVFFVLSLNLYIKLRPKYSISVNCWFCNQWSNVPYDWRNSWDCPFCEQYNGFTEEGDYNIPIPAQHDELMNNQVPFKIKTSTVPADNGLCSTCNNNQQLKIHQLSVFSPIDENKFDEEIEKYQNQLERAYRLCSQCEQTVKNTLRKQKSFLLSARLSKLRKHGLDFINLNISQPGLSKTAKQNLFLTAIRCTTILLAVIRIFEIVNTFDFSDIQLKKTFPGAIVPYALLTKDLYFLLYNSILSFYDYIQYLRLISVSSIFNYLSDFNFTYIEYTFSYVYTSYLTKLDNAVILSSVGFFLQCVVFIFSDNAKVFELIISVFWSLLMCTGLGYLSETLHQVRVSSNLLEIILCCLIAILTSSTRTKRPTKISSHRKSHNAMTNEHFNDELPTDKHVDLLNSTFKSDDSSPLNSLETSRSVSPFQGFPSSSPLKLFNANKNSEFETHLFGQQAVFENPLNTTYFKFSPKYRSTGSSNDSYTTRKSVWSDSINTSQYSDLNEAIPVADTSEIRLTEHELNKGLSDLHLGVYPNMKKRHNTDMPPVFRVSSPLLNRPKPVLSPPRLSNVTQSSWVAGGYWKPNNDFLPISGSFSNLSRSSSQSSGFGSQASSQQRNFENNNFSSLPSSRNNSVCGDHDKFSVLSEPAYQYKTNNFNTTNCFYPVLRPDQQLNIYPKPSDINQSRLSPVSVLNDSFWSLNSSNVTFSIPNSTRPSSRESNLSQTFISCNNNLNVSHNPFYNHSKLFNANSSNQSTISSNIVKGSLLKSWREQNSLLQLN